MGRAPGGGAERGESALAGPKASSSSNAMVFHVRMRVTTLGRRRTHGVTIMVGETAPPAGRRCRKARTSPARFRARGELRPRAALVADAHRPRDAVRVLEQRHG